MPPAPGNSREQKVQSTVQEKGKPHALEGEAKYLTELVELPIEEGATVKKKCFTLHLAHCTVQ
jgi:hypothetical protein